MQMPEVSLIEWQKRFGTERKCAQTLAKVRWPKGFQCPACGGMKAYPITWRHLYQCAHCRHQVSITADACLKSNPMPGSQLYANLAKPDFMVYDDHFTNSTPESEWRTCLEHAEKIGVGTSDYKLIKVK